VHADATGADEKVIDGQRDRRERRTVRGRAAARCGNVDGGCAVVEANLARDEVEQVDRQLPVAWKRAVVYAIVCVTEPAGVFVVIETGEPTAFDQSSGAVATPL